MADKLRWLVRCPFCLQEIWIYLLDVEITHHSPECGEKFTYLQQHVIKAIEPKQTYQERMKRHYSGDVSQRIQLARDRETSTWLSQEGSRMTASAEKQCPVCKHQILKANTSCHHCSFVFTELDDRAPYIKGQQKRKR
jgi:hypothetical protein